jgi:hypothetical protein
VSDEAARAIARFCAEHPGAVLYDEAAATLRDVFSGKTLRLRPVQSTAAKTASDGGDPYLVVLFEDDRQIALAAAGIAFPPDLRNAGPLPGLPQVVCWRDFANVGAQIEHALSAHPDAPPDREVLDMLRFEIALVDGARAAGFDVGEDERRIERWVHTVEQRVGKP